MDRTPTQRHADRILGKPVEQWIAEQRGPAEKPLSWNRIALLLRDTTDREVGVTGKTIQTWAEAPHEVTVRRDNDGTFGPGSWVAECSRHEWGGYARTEDQAHRVGAAHEATREDTGNEDS